MSRQGRPAHKRGVARRLKPQARTGRGVQAPRAVPQGDALALLAGLSTAKAGAPGTAGTGASAGSYGRPVPYEVVFAARAAADAQDAAKRSLLSSDRRGQLLHEVAELDRMVRLMEQQAANESGEPPGSPKWRAALRRDAGPPVAPMPPRVLAAGYELAADAAQPPPHLQGSAGPASTGAGAPSRGTAAFTAREGGARCPTCHRDAHDSESGRFDGDAPGAEELVQRRGDAGSASGSQTHVSGYGDVSDLLGPGSKRASEPGGAQLVAALRRALRAALRERRLVEQALAEERKKHADTKKFMQAQLEGLLADAAAIGADSQAASHAAASAEARLRSANEALSERVKQLERELGTQSASAALRMVRDSMDADRLHSGGGPRQEGTTTGAPGPDRAGVGATDSNGSVTPLPSRLGRPPRTPATSRSAVSAAASTFSIESGLSVAEADAQRLELVDEVYALRAERMQLLTELSKLRGDTEDAPGVHAGGTGISYGERATGDVLRDDEFETLSDLAELAVER